MKPANTAIWGSLSGPARDACLLVFHRAAARHASAPQGTELSTKADDWTPQNAAIAASAIVEKYPNPTTATLNLGKFRKVLGLIYAPLPVPASVIAATLRPDITVEHNRRNEAARAERVARGIEVPQPFERLADIRERVERFVAAPAPTAQTAADLMVAFAARPGEASSIDIGERGGVRGVTVTALKKRDKAGAPMYAVAGALGEPLAVRFVEAWKASPVKARTKAMRTLPDLCRTWGLQVRDLRALGATLAVRADVLAGRVQNDGQARDAHRSALRHEPPAPGARPAAEHYARVNDPVALLCAQLAELSTADRDRVAAIVRGARSEGQAARPVGGASSPVAP